jgi:hypothetical protein
MAWLRSEQSLLHHPKTHLLQSYLKTTLPETIGRLHMLWYWCLDYALDGDLSRKEPKMIEQSCQIPLKLLIKAGFVDSRPYRRIHDWYGNQSYYLKSRYKDNPSKLEQIRTLYKTLDAPVLHGSNTRVKPVYSVDKQTNKAIVSENELSIKRKEDARADAPGGAPLAEEEMMTPEEMKAIRIKNMGKW